MSRSPAEDARASYLRLFELSRGGMGRVEVVARRAGRFTRLFAAKRLLPHLAEDPAVRALFLEEARLAGLIHHPNVVSVVDVGADAEGPFLVMELVIGAPLSLIVQRAATDAQLVPVQIAARLAADVARGLEAAHALRDADGNPLGLVHRDVCPQNILVGFDGVARVTDFGVARAVDALARTHTGTLKGKVGYMAPERLRYEPFDHRADLFSLGVVLFEVLSGERLYDDPDATAVARRVLAGPLPEVGARRRDVPPALEELLFELLAKSPEARPAGAGAVAARLDEIVAELVQGEGSIEPGALMASWFHEDRTRQEARVRTELGRAAARERRRRWRRVLVASAVVAGTVATGAVGWLRARRPPPYPLGFTWQRAEAYRPGTRAGAPDGNPAADARGRPAWSWEVTEGAATAEPWYARQTRHMSWDRDWLGQGSSTWARGDDLGPTIVRHHIVHILGRSGVYVPAARWTNPTGEQVHVDVTGRVTFTFHRAVTTPATFVIVKQAPGGREVLFRYVAQPHQRPPAAADVTLTAIPVPPGASLVFTVRGEGAEGHVSVTDALRLTLVEGFARRP